MIARRRFIRSMALLLLAGPLRARTEAVKAVRRIGVLSPGPTLTPSQYGGVWTPLRDLGWVEGRNLVFERRWAEGVPARLRPLADELVRRKVELIVTIGTEATIAARDATSSIPIVMLSAADPVGAGLVASLASPGGNVTGISMVGPEIEAKRVALLREMVPDCRRIGVLVDPQTAVSGYSRAATEAAYRSAGVEPVFVEVHSPDEFDHAAAEVVRRGGQASVIHRDVLFSLHSASIMSAVSKYRLPAAVEDRSMLEAGGLMSYAVDDVDLLRRFAAFVDRILRGARPADLPVEQPTKFVLAINLRTAKALGLTVPSSLLLRADEVIR
jgi:putative ABC transport system substrate-binding protein